MTYTQAYGNLHAASLTLWEHERTCGYWFTVTSGSMAHTAFATRAGLDCWLAERGLSLASELPEAGTAGLARINGEYRAASHGEFLSDDHADGMGPGGFYSLRPVLVTAAQSNGDYTLALITEEDGIRVVSTLNPNVHSRLVFDRQLLAAAMR